MPRIRRRLKRQTAKAEPLDDVMEMFLAEGHDFFFGIMADHRSDCADPDRVVDRDRLEANWNAHREEVMAKHIAAFPGCRPWAWWILEAPPERRRILSGATPIIDGPGVIKGDHRFGKIPGNYPYGAEPVYESERDYLKRHQLLIDGK